MKKISAIGLLLFLCTLTSLSQGVYSKQNLGQASVLDLNKYLRDAMNKRTEGVIMAIAGPVCCVGGALILDNQIRKNETDSYEESNEKFKSGFILLGVGFLATVVSVPTIVTGSIRVGKVRNAMKNYSGTGLSLSPGFVKDNLSQNFNPSITLTLRF